MSFNDLIAPLTSLFGVRAGMNVHVQNAPEGFLEAFKPLPDGAALVAESKLGLDMQILFATTKPALIDHLTRLIQKMSVMGCVWVCFPAEQDAYTPSEDFVRIAAAELGLSDTKKLMVNAQWNALKLQRKGSSPRPELPQARA
jgi:hypothetical protein